MENYEKKLKEALNRNDVSFNVKCWIRNHFQELAEQKPEWSEEDSRRLNRIEIILKHDISSSSEDIAWLNSLKDRVQPKQEWSEEDRDLIEELISYFRNEIAIGSLDSEHYKNYIIPKLISFRPQSQWKPTEEQMRELFNMLHRGNTVILYSLYNDLKAL